MAAVVLLLPVISERFTLERIPVNVHTNVRNLNAEKPSLARRIIKIIYEFIQARNLMSVRLKIVEGDSRNTLVYINITLFTRNNDRSNAKFASGGTDKAVLL